MSHSQSCARQALGAAVQHANQALGSGLFASKPKRTSAVLADIARLADKLLAEERVACICPDAEMRRRVRELSAMRRAARGLVPVVNGTVPR